MKFKEILIAIDGHSSATDTIDIGLELALIYGARLHIAKEITNIDNRH